MEGFHFTPPPSPPLFTLTRSPSPLSDQEETQPHNISLLSAETDISDSTTLNTTQADMEPPEWDKIRHILEYTPINNWQQLHNCFINIASTLAANQQLPSQYELQHYLENQLNSICPELIAPLNTMILETPYLDRLDILNEAQAYCQSRT